MEESKTTEGITRDDVSRAMSSLGIFDIKPEVPLEVTVSGHEIVAVARRFEALEQRLGRLEQSGQLGLR